MSLGNYEKIRCTTDIVILTTSDKAITDERKVPTKGLQVMLIKRQNEPFKEHWTLPGGFVDYNKTLIECVNTKLKQKTGVDNLYKEQLYTYGDDLTRDPRERIITVSYLALTSKDKTNISNCHGELETDWFWVETERRQDGNVTEAKFIRDTTGEVVTTLGFDHKQIIINAINRLSNKIMYTEIGFNLVPDMFTLTELQMAYEAVKGKPIPGFRRIIKDKVEAMGISTFYIREKPDQHRPSELYRRKTAENKQEA